MIESAEILAISAVIPTAGRRARLVKTIRSILSQEILPVEIVIVDGSDRPWVQSELDEATGRASSCGVRFTVATAEIRGAGMQRNQGVSISSQPFIWFLDDDVDLQPGCLKKLWEAMNADDQLGGCNAAITNQGYHAPSRSLRLLLALVGCPLKTSLAGKCCGPALNFLPVLELDADPERTDWLNTTCTLYRRSAIPSPPFLPFFQGYSLMEDLALSLEVNKGWTLVNCPGAKIFHDSKVADYKGRTVKRQSMEVANRWFVLSKILDKSSCLSLLSLLGYQAVGLLGLLAKPVRWVLVPGWFVGSLVGLLRIIRESSNWQGYPMADKES